MKQFLSYIRGAVTLTVVLFVICSVIYPAAVTGIGTLLFPRQAAGSLIEKGGTAVGSELIGQDFTDPKYFRGRISSVDYNTYTKQEKADGAYKGVSSGSYNYGPSNPELKKRVETDIAKFKELYRQAVGSEFTGELPADLFTASGSGLDPDISPEAAQVQIPIVAAFSGLSKAQVQQIVKENTEHKLFGLFGEDRVNVLKTNLAIEKMLGDSSNS